MEGIRSSWLGIPIIECDGKKFQLETKKAVALLAYLGLSSPLPLTRENLATLFWPEYDQQHAYANLRRTLYSINHELRSDLIISNRESLMLNSSCQFWQDVGDFRIHLSKVKSHNHKGTACGECITNLEKVIALYRGSFLEGLNLRDSPEFDKWQYFQREDFLQDLTFSLEQLSRAYISLGEWEKGIPRARHWLSLDQLNENAQKMLIELLAKAGQHSAALHQFEKYSRILNDELGQSLNDEMKEFYQDIRNGGLRSRDACTGISTTTPSVASREQPLIKTKLFIPRLRKDYVPRPLLLEKLAQDLKKSLTLVSAPAGYGKTTLLAEWIHSLSKMDAPVTWAICWFSLDAGDNDPIRFLTYLTAALEKVGLEVSAETRVIIRTFEENYPKTPLTMLLNDLQDRDQSVLLVMDDYQFINNPVIHDGIAFLLENLPENIHVVIVTRSDPPIPLSRLRVRGQLSEIREEDLRFKTLEATRFLNQVFGLDLSQEQIAKLKIRTEGWIAGLQLAAVSMQGRLDIPEFIEAFSGSHRFIMDYLAEETLIRQPSEIQRYLLETSILERLNDSLCDFVMNIQGKNNALDPHSPNESPPTPEKHKIHLETLENMGLFIVPQDDERIWYRYHHLFADVLRSRLERTSPELVPTLHERASKWFEKQRLVEESITHTLAAKDWDNVSRLIYLHFRTYMENGHLTTVLKWIEGIPQDVIFKYLKLCTIVAEVYSQAGMINQIDPFLDRADEILSAYEIRNEDSGNTQNLSLSAKERTEIRSMTSILRGLKSVCLGDPQGAVNFTQTAITNLPEMEPRELAVLFWVEGWAYRNLGDLPGALERLTKATEYTLKSGAVLRDTWIDLGNVTRLVGKLPQAIDIISTSLQNAIDRGIHNQGNISRDETFLSFIYFEQNKLDLAMRHATQALAHTKWWPSHAIIAMANLSLAQIFLVQGNLDDSLLAIQKADQKRKNWLMTPFVQSLAEVTWARIWLHQDKWDLLDEWSNDKVMTLNSTLGEGRLVDEYLEMQLIMVVRVWMEKTKFDKNLERNNECVQLLDRLENCSETAGRINSLVEILFLRAVIHFLQGNQNGAIGDLEKCLSMAEPGGYMQIFLDTGESARSFISSYLQKPDPINKTYALKILKSFGGYLQTSANKTEYSEALTPREMEVLHLLAEGYSNQQMAEKLIVSVGTIKFHVHQILGKLQVKSRTQAIVRAKDLDLI